MTRALVLKLALTLALTPPLTIAGCDFGFEVGDLPDAAADASASDGGDGAVTNSCGQTEVTVRIRGLAFDQKHLHIPVGTRVRWINEDTVVHDVTEGDPGDPASDWTSGQLAPGASWSRDFCAPISLRYHCAAHAAIMRDYVVVVEQH